MRLLGSMLVAAILTLSPAAFARTDAQGSFDKLKSLAGSWEGTAMTDPPDPSVAGKLIEVSLRVTSMGNALMHEMRVAGRPDDPITMLYLDGEQLLLTHYCDAGNRPRMAGKLMSDGKSIEFNLLDVTGNMQYGHMHQAVFGLIDANHHTEDWNFMMADKVGRGHFDLHRTK